MASLRETWKGLASEQSLTELTSALEASTGTYKRVSADFTRPADTTNYTAGDQIAPAAAKVKQVSTVTLTGAGGLASITGTGGLTSTVTFNTTLGQTAIDFVATYDTPYDELTVPVTITAVGDTIVFTAKNYDGVFIVPTITNVSDTLSGAVTHSTANRVAVAQKETISLAGTAAEKQVETMAITATTHTKMKVTIPLTGTLPVAQVEDITLTGTSGTFTISGTGGFTNLVTWTTDLTGTATAFVNGANIAEYATAGVTLSASTTHIIFTAAVPGTPFTIPTITAGDTDLGGTIATTANVVAGTANLTVVGLAPKLITFTTNLTTTANNFVTSWAASYYAINGITLTANTGSLILESTAFGVPFGIPDVATLTGNLSHGDIDQTVAYVATGAGTVSGVGSPKTITFATSVDATAAAYVSTNAAAYLVAGIVLTASTSNLVFTAATAGTSFTSPVFTNTTGDMAGEVTVNQVNVAQGVGTITGTGISKTITFVTDASATALAFKNANAVYYATVGAILTNSTNKIIFTASSAGTGFTSPVFTNTAGDLAGTLADSATDYYANVTAIKQVETVLITGTSGTLTVTATGGLTKTLTFVEYIRDAIIAFVNANATAYLAQSVVLTGTNTQLVFTALNAGTGFTAPVITNITDNLAGTIVSTANISLIPLTLSGMASVGSGGLIKDIKLETSSTAFATKVVRVWLFNDVPTGVVGDNVAYINLIGDADFRNACPYVDITFDALLANSTVVIGKAHPDVEYVCASDSGDMYALLQSVDAVTTPASEASFKLTLNVIKS